MYRDPSGLIIPSANFRDLFTRTLLFLGCFARICRRNTVQRPGGAERPLGGRGARTELLHGAPGIMWEGGGPQNCLCRTSGSRGLGAGGWASVGHDWGGQFLHSGGPLTPSLSCPAVASPPSPPAPQTLPRILCLASAYSCALCFRDLC